MAYMDMEAYRSKIADRRRRRQMAAAAAVIAATAESCGVPFTE
jgi:hypothetical protein